MKILAKILFALALIAVIMWLAGCTLTKQQRQSNRIVKKIERMKVKHPEAFQDATTETVRIDTVIQKIELEGRIRFDTIEVEKLVKKYVRDTVLVRHFISRFLEVSKDTLQVDTLGLHLWLSGSALTYKLTKDEAHIEKEQDIKTVTITKTEVIRRGFWQDWRFYILICIFISVFIFKDVLKTRFKC